MTLGAEQLVTGLPRATYHYKQLYVEHAERHSSVLTIPVSKLKAVEFRYYLAKRLPLVITGLNRELQLPWSPSQLMRDYGEEQCTVEDCEGREPPSKRSLRDFLSNFLEDGVLHENTAVWKVKV
jgi:lysine-specific demethylase 3